MSTNGIIFVSFVTGAAVGAVVSWAIAKENYEQIANEDHKKEIELREKKEEQNKDNNISKPVVESLSDLVYDISPQNKPDPAILAESVIKDNGYRYHGETLYSDIYKKDKEKTEEKLPYLIDEENVGELEDYDVITLTYYIPDRTLVDENDNIIKDMEHVLGPKVLDELDENEGNGDVEAYARDDRLKCDYEIILEHESYFDVIGG